MKALYWKRPTAAQLAGTGLKLKHYPEPHVEVWPEHWDVLQLFKRNASQWRVGGGGPIGLAYNVLFHELERAGTTGDDFDDAIACMRIIEQAALEEIHKD